MRELLQMPEYLDLIRKRQALKEKKNNYLRDINKDNFTNDDDKFLDLEPRIDEDIHSIKANMNHIADFKKKFAKQLEDQRKYMRKLDASLEMTQKTTKRYFYGLLTNKGKSNNEVNILDDSALQTSPKKTIAKVEETPDRARFNTPKMKESFQLNSQPDQEEREHTKDDYEIEELQSREMLQSKSRKTVDFLRSLQLIKEKNKSISVNINSEKKKKKDNSFFETSLNDCSANLNGPLENIINTFKNFKKKENSPADPVGNKIELSNYNSEFEALKAKHDVKKNLNKDAEFNK